jgi:hypothetical protein
MKDASVLSDLRIGLDKSSRTNRAPWSGRWPFVLNESWRGQKRGAALAKPYACRSGCECELESANVLPAVNAS